MAPRTATVRLAHSVVAQHRRTLRCPPSYRLDNCLALVTGGNKGIGAAVTDELEVRGSRVIVAAREVSDPISDRTGSVGTLGSRVGLRLDLADLHSVCAGCRPAGRETRRGVARHRRAQRRRHPRPRARSRHRATSGHSPSTSSAIMCCCSDCTPQGCWRPPRGVVGVTGDIQVLARDCTPELTNSSRRAGWIAYARSKLGTTWLYGETARRHPDMTVIVAHPGVVSSGLTRGGAPGARRHRGKWARSRPVSAPKRSSVR